jgi:signal transduction histidine kinase
LETQTLTFYSLSAGLCFGLSMLLIAYAQLQRGTLLIRSGAFAMLVLALAFFFAGYGSLLPLWTTRIGTNVLLLTAIVVLYSGFYAYVHDQSVQIDRFGASLIALTIPPFYWWGLVEPDGLMRSIVFSLVCAMLNARISRLLITRQQSKGGLPAKLLATLFAVAALWMLARTLVLLLSDPMPPAQQGNNPTTWVTVFWFNVLIAAFTSLLLAMERQRSAAMLATQALSAKSTGLEGDRSNLLLLWTLVGVIALTILAEVGIAYSVLYQRERDQLQVRSQLANQAFVEHSEQVISQVDILIRATRGLVERGIPPQEMERFIQRLNFPHDIIENIYVIDADGQLILPLEDRSKKIDTTQRDYFQFHQQNPADVLFISPVSVGLVTGKQQFRITRRFNDPAGRFAGVILIPLEPKAFTRLFDRMLITNDAIASLIGIDDKKIRARTPEIDDPKIYHDPIDKTPLWDYLSSAPIGSYRNTSQVDGRERLFNYQRVGELPLVMVSALSIDDIHQHARQSIQPIGLGALLALTVVFLLATVLSGVIRKREEQENFISMLGHELKTPLSVIRMTIGHQRLDSDSEARISRSVQEMQAVIERCLQADRLRHGLLTATLSQLDLNALLQEIVDDPRSRDRVTLNTETLPPCVSDGQLLRTILGNLVENAIKYGKSGQPIQIHARAAERRKRAGIAISVANQPGAAGFPDARQIFRKYYRAPAAHGKTGSGLGLYISAGFARMIGGTLSYQPGNNEVRFELWIPR